MKIFSSKEGLKKAFWELLKLIVPGLVGFAFAYITFAKQYDAQERGRLNDNLNKILDVTLEFPYLDDSAFIAHWSRNKNSNGDSSLRYQTYCEYVFNFLQDVCEYYHYDRHKVEQYIDVDDLIIQQREWWEMPEQQSTLSYPREFRNFVGYYFNGR